MTAIAALAFLAWAYLLFGHARFWQLGPVLRAASPAVPASLPAVDVVVPARDEAEGIGAALRSLLAQDYAGPLRVIVIDDGSTDGTGALARAMADPRPLVLHDPAHVATLAAKAAKAERDGLDLVSKMMELRCTSWKRRAYGSAGA